MPQQIKLTIPTMKCKGCVAAVEKALKQETAVLGVMIDLASKQADINTELSAASLISSLQLAGFAASEITV